MLKNKKNLLIIAAFILLAGAAGGFYYLNHKNDNVGNSGGDINYGPPTQTEKQDAENHKKQIDQQEAAAQKSSDSSYKKVTPVIISSGQVGDYVKVSARVPGVIENSGTCTLTMTMDGTRVSQSKEAAPNVSEMSCGFISIARSKLSSGNWSATVSYSSTKASGSSEAVVIGVK